MKRSHALKLRARIEQALAALEIVREQPQLHRIAGVARIEAERQRSEGAAFEVQGVSAFGKLRAARHGDAAAFALPVP